MNLVLNVHTSLHYNLQGTCKINIHHEKIIQHFLCFVLQKHMLVFISFKQFKTSLNKERLNMVLSQNLFTKTTSCPSLSSLKLPQVLQSQQQMQSKHTLVEEGVDKEHCALLIFSCCSVFKGQSCPVRTARKF